MTDRYITPGGYGDGSSLSQAGPISSVNTQIASAISGGGKPRILVVPNRGPYPVPMKKPGNLASDNASSDSLNDAAVFTIDANTSGLTNPVEIVGMSDDMVPMEATFLSDRIRPYTSQNKAHRRYPGQGGFELKSSFVTFRNLKFRDFGYGCVQVTTACDSVVFEDVAFDNVRRGIWVKSTGGLTNSVMRRLVGKGTSKSFIELDGAGSVIEIGDFDFDGDGQSGDNFALGIHLAGDYDDVWVHGSPGAPSRSGNYRIGVNDPDYTDYWNCDGIAAEGPSTGHAGITKLRIDDVLTWGNTDGGFDIKGVDAVLTRCIARENKRNYRMWHSGITLVDCEGYRPVHPGGTGSAAQIWAGTNGANGGQRVIGGVFDNEDATTAVVDNSATNPVRFEGTEIRVPSASVTLASGGGATYDERTRIVYTKVRPVLKTADFLAATPVAFMGLRLLDGNYAGPLIKVRRVDTGATVDIYPTSTGALDTPAISAHCGAAVGTIATIYDQSGNGRNATTAVTTREYRIWTGSAITTVGSSGKPFAFIDAEDRGYTFAIPTLTGNTLSAVLVGSLGNGVVNSTAGGRFMSLLDSSSTNTDSNATTRAILIGRAGGTTPSSSWQVYRNSAQLVAATSAYDTPEQISTIFDGTNVSLRRNNGSPVQAASSAAFNGTRIALGFAGNSTFRSPPGSYVAEWWFFSSALSAADRDELYADEKAFFGLP
jgi:Alpha-L-arabinofuranosidase B, catalytic